MIFTYSKVPPPLSIFLRSLRAFFFSSNPWRLEKHRMDMGMGGPSSVKGPDVLWGARCETKREKKKREKKKAP